MLITYNYYYWNNNYYWDGNYINVMSGLAPYNVDPGSWPEKGFPGRPVNFYYSRTKLKFIWNPAVKSKDRHPVGFLTLFQPVDDPRTPDVDESQNYEKVPDACKIVWDGVAEESPEFTLDVNALFPNRVGSIIMVPAQLGVDANRDGVINFSQSGDPTGSDVTMADKPFRFWLNDDDDVNADNPDDAEKAPVSKADWEDDKIDGIRDLEDFARLNIYMGGLQDAIVAGTLKVGLKWKNITSGAPAIKVWRNMSPQGGTEYLYNETIARQKLTLTAPGYVHGTGTYIIPAQFWADNSFSTTQPNGYMLFEGCAEGKGQLVISICKADGTEIGEGPGVWIDLKNIKQMYQRVKALAAGGDNIAVPSDFTGPDDNNIPHPVMSWTDDPNGYTFEAPLGETKTCIVMVHGWNQTYERSTMYAETAFKRLWHRGYKGRFVRFRWPTYVGLTTYNDSEYRAWKCGESLKQYLDSIPRGSGGFTVNMIAHSMGNIVAGEALKRGASVTNYALWNAAVPACCYDGSTTLDQGWGYTHPNNDPASYTRNLTYQGRLAGVSGNLINFFLPRDDALKKWEWNNDTPGVAGRFELTGFRPQPYNAFTTGYGYDRGDTPRTGC